MLQRTFMATLFAIPLALGTLFFVGSNDAEAACYRQFYYGYSVWVCDSTPASTPAPTTTDVERLLVTRINEARAKAGRHALSYDTKLAAVADYRCPQIMKTFNHDGFRPALKAFGIYIWESNIDKYFWASEVIAYGQKTPEEVLVGFMGSPSHKGIILNATYDWAGAARCGPVSGYTDRFAWVVVLAGPR